MPDVESRLPVGSSANTTAGREIRARAIATRCCCPPESSEGRCVARSAMPTVASSWSRQAGIDVVAGDADRKLDVLGGVEDGDEVEELEDEAELLAAQLRQALVVERRHLDAVDPGLAAGRLVEAGEQVHQRRLAGSGGADDRGQLTGREVEGDAAERVDGGLALAEAAAQVAAGDDAACRLCRLIGGRVRPAGLAHDREVNTLGVRGSTRPANEEMRWLQQRYGTDPGDGFPA